MYHKISLTVIAAMVRQRSSKKQAYLLESGAGEGVRTLDFHLGKSFHILLLEINRGCFLLFIKEIVAFLVFLLYPVFNSDCGNAAAMEITVISSRLVENRRESSSGQINRYKFYDFQP
jgi:hypothetical protein